MTKLEIGCGHRPTRGYDLHNDLWPWPGVDLVGPAWMVDLPDNSLDEVLALAFIEHLTRFEALDTFRNVHRMLKPGGLFLFDAPDYPYWAALYLEQLRGQHFHTPKPSLDDCRRTLFGWGRWPGDEHKYGWDRIHLYETLKLAGFNAIIEDKAIDSGMPHFVNRVHRDRFNNPADAHLYVAASKT